MKTTVKLTVQEMVGFLKTITSESMFMSMDTRTLLEPGKKLVKDCPYGTVTKTAKVQGALNWDYAKRVRTLQAKAAGVPLAEVPEYERKSTWHTALLTEDGKATVLRVNKKTPNNGEFYLFYEHIRTVSASYTDSKGNAITYEELKPYFKERDEDEAKPAVRCIKIANVQQLRACGIIIKGTAQASGSMTVPAIEFNNEEDAMRDAFQWLAGKSESA